MNTKSFIRAMLVSMLVLFPSLIFAQVGEIHFKMSKLPKDMRLPTGITKPFILVLKLEGEGISFDGVVQEKDVMLGKNKDVPAKYYCGTPDKEIVIKGDVSVLKIIYGSVESADLSKASKSLKTFWMRRTWTSSFNLKGLTEVEDLIVRDQKGLKELDLSDLHKARIMELGKFACNNYGWDLKTVILPNPTVVEDLNLSDTAISEIEFPALPKLKKFYASGTQIPEFVFNSPNLEVIELSRAHAKKLHIKGSTPNLKKIWLQDMFKLEELIIENAPNIKDATKPAEMKDINNLYFSGSFFNQLKVLKLNTGIERIAPIVNNVEVSKYYPNVEVLDLYNSPIKKLDLSSFVNLKELRLPFDGLSSEDYDTIIASIKADVKKQLTVEIMSTRKSDQKNLATFIEKLKAAGIKVKNEVAVETLITSSYKVYPTQTTDLVKIEGTKIYAPYSVYNAGGKLCLSGNTNASGKANLSLAVLPKGMYLIKVGSVYTKVLLK